MKKLKVTAGRVLFFLLVAFLTLTAYFYWVSRKPIRKEVQVAYSVNNLVFRNSLDALLGNEFVAGNSIETLVNGDEIFPSMLGAIRSAEKTITFETYIWSQGKVCDQMKEALSERAKAGVQVLVVVDGMGSLKLRQADITELTAAGVRIVKFNRDQWYKVNIQFNHRDHRKLLVVDGKIGFIGGACLHDAWLGNAETPEQWRDTHYRITGPAVRQLQGIFADNWRQTTGEVLHGPDFFPTLSKPGDFPVQAYMCGPKDGQETARVGFLYAIASAKKSIRIAHAYFMPDELATKTLLAARQRGVEIEVIVPGKLDSKIVKGASRSSWPTLMEAGVKFYEYGPAMFHVKNMIIDDLLVIAGSANFDNRSFRINDEANFNVIDATFAAEQIDIFKKDKEASRPLTLADLKKRPMLIKMSDKVAAIFSSQF